MAGAVTASISNQLVSTFDIHKPDKQNFLFRKYGKQGVTAFQFLQALGFVSPVAQGSYSHYEEDYIHQTITVKNNVAATGAGNAALITLAAADLDSLNNFYPRVGDGILFKNGVPAVISSINTGTPSAPVLTVYPNKVADEIGALTAGETVIIFTNVFAEGTANPDGRVSTALEYTFNTQIIKETVKGTGSELTNMNWFNTIDGTSIPSWFAKNSQIDLDYRMMLAIDGMTLFGETIDNPALTALGLRQSSGLVPSIEADGNVGNYTPGLFSIANVDQMNRTLDKQFAPNEYAGFLGYQFFQDIENTSANYFTQNPAIFAGGAGQSVGSLMYGDNMQAIGDKNLTIGFRSITKSDRTFHLLKLPQLTNPKLYGANGYTQPSLGIFCPLDKPVAPKGGAMPRVGLRYKELGGYSRKMETFYLGGAGNIPVKTSSVDEIILNQRCEMGTEFFGLNAFYLWKA